MKSIKGFIIGFIISAFIFNAEFILAKSDEIIAKFISLNFVVNGEVKTLDSQPLVYNGTTYLPVRVIANLLGFDVTYKADNKTIEFNSHIKNETMNTNQINTNNDININEKYKIKDEQKYYEARYIIEVLAKKYPDDKSIGFVTSSNNIYFNYETIKLECFSEADNPKKYCLITPLVEKGIVNHFEFD